MGLRVPTTPTSCGPPSATWRNTTTRTSCSCRQEGDHVLQVPGLRLRGSQHWQGISDQPGIDDARKVARAAAKAFSDGDVDEVRLAYTKYHSALTQRPTVVQLLPLPEEELEEMAQEPVNGRRGQATSSSRSPRTSWASCSLATSRAPSSRGCSRPQPRSTPPGAGR